MAKVCKKCGYERKPTDVAADYECPHCGAIYAKVEAHLKKEAEKEKQLLELEKKKAEREEKIAEGEKKNEERKEQRFLKNSWICCECGYLGQPTRITPGHLLIEIALWLMFLLPGLIYSIWRLNARHNACPDCLRDSMIRATSPKGKKLMAELAIEP